MDLQQIEAGNYDSLSGAWTQVAGASNPQDGTGVQWSSGGTSKIEISSDAIAINDRTTLRGTTLSVDVGNGPVSIPFTFQDNGAYLEASLEDNPNTPINYALGFYPKGSVDLNSTLMPNNGVNLDSSRDTIHIWSSNNGIHLVFARVADNPAPPTQADSPDRNGQWDGSGCSPGPGTLPDGWWFGYPDSLLSRNGETVGFTFDLACFKLRDDRGGIGSYIDNRNPSLRNVYFGASAERIVARCHGGGDFDAEGLGRDYCTAADVLSDYGWPEVWVRVQGGVVTELVEQFSGS